MAGKNIIVLGGGLAGLGVAWHLQNNRVPCVVLEKEQEPGGLCRSKQVNGFTFDYDGHLLHFRHGTILDQVKSLLGANLVRHNRSAWVYSHGRLMRYPFQANLYGLPSPIVKECLASFVKAAKSPKALSGKNFLQWIKGTFGDGIARHFMVPYNTKFWTVPPQQMTCGWLDGFVPQPTLNQVIDGAIAASRHQLGYNAHFWYPARGGIGVLPQALGRKIKQVRTGCEVKRIDLAKRLIKCADGHEERYSHIVSTIPLPELARIIYGLPGSVRKEFERLRWNSVFNLNLGIKHRLPADKHWIYFPQKELVFFRVGFYHNFADRMTPEGAGALYAEVSYSQHRPLDKKKVVARIEKDLRKVGLLSSSDDIIQRDINDIQYAYPIYDKVYETARRNILDYLAENHIRTCGRYGSWRYMSMEDVLLEAKDLTERCFF